LKRSLEKTKTNTVVLRFTKSIYSKKAVQDAVREYFSLAKISLLERKAYWQVCIAQLPPRLKNRLPLEFSNAVLILTKNYA
jgi:hypothetical protein